MLRLRDIHKSYSIGNNRLHVLKGVDLDVDAGELVSVMGSSGSGKSTLMNIIGLLDSHDEGTYSLDSEAIGDLTERRAAMLRSRLIGFVFQSFHLIQWKTAAENVALPLYYQRVGRRERNALATEYLERVGLADRATHLPKELSGGQQQRVAIARALIAQPKLLLADEPTGALDSTTSREVMGVLRTVQERDGVTIVIVTHEPHISAATDRVIHIADGRIEDDGRQNGVGRSARPSPASLAATAATAATTEAKPVGITG